MEGRDPLTKAKLFASHESGQWTEIGLGVVSVVVEPLPPSTFADDTPINRASPPSPSGGSGGKRGRATDAEAGRKLVARLQMVSLDSPTDLLLSSYVSLDDIYTIQGDTILLWYDDAVSNEIACSFNSKEGCDRIYADITAYQQSERLRRVQDERVPALMDKFLVHSRNLPGICEAAQSQNKRFGLYVRDDPQYFVKLAQLFHASKAKQDTVAMELIARIVLLLFQPPYNSEGKIIAQFVENDRIDDCIDIVQYGLGRRDKASGFVSFEERRATFRDPCHLPEALLPRIHVLYSCGYLKDLIPLSLEPADAASCSSLLSTFTLRFTMNLLTEIVMSPSILPEAFRTAVEAVQLDSPAATPAPADLTGHVAHLFELAAFVGDIAKTVKNAQIGIDMRAEIFSSLVRVGILPFLTAVLACALRCYDMPECNAATQGSLIPSRAVQLVCDTLYSCAAHFPECVEDLVVESSAAPKRCLLQLLLSAIGVVRSGAEMQSVVDAVQCCSVGVPLTLAMFGDNAQLEARRHEVVRFWIEGSAVDHPPVFYLAKRLADLLQEAAAASPSGGESTVAGGEHIGIKISSASGLHLSAVHERQLIYGQHIISAMLAKADASRCHRLVEVLTLSKLTPALALALANPQRRLANLQSSITAFMVAVLGRREARLLPLITGDTVPNLLQAAVELFLLSSHRDNILNSALAHLLTVVSDGVHREKLQHTFSLGCGRDSAPGPSPFVTILRNEDSISKTEQTSPTLAPMARPYEAAASEILAQFGERLAVAVPLLFERLKTALAETPEQAQQVEAESSSLASSVERSALSGFSDFDAAAIDFGLETPTGTPILDPGADARRQVLTGIAAATVDGQEEDDDDVDDEGDPLASLSSIEEDSESEEEEAAPPGAASPSPDVGARTDGVQLSSSLPSAGRLALSSPPVTAAESVDAPCGRGSLLEDEENRSPHRASLKRVRTEADLAEEEAEAKRGRVEESAA